MRLTSLEGSEAGYESENTFDTKRSSSITKSKDLVVKIEAQMERLKKPPSERDFSYFMKIRLSGLGINLHKLKVGHDVPMEKLVETFGKAIPRSRFWYIECRDLDMKVKVEKIWLLCYGKVEMHYSKLITKEFALGIVVKKFNKIVSWATSTKKTNTN
jgi:hypothetical protein